MKSRQSESARQRLRNARLRAAVIAAYGGECACCGERTPEFLAIDHVNGREPGDDRTGVKLYAWLVRHRFPEGYRVLCHNCNLSLGFWGYCPHGLRSTTGRRSGYAAPPAPPGDRLF